MSIPIVVKAMDGTSLNLNISPEDTIAKLKDIIATEYGVQAEIIRLVYKGKGTEDVKTMESLGVQPNDVFNQIFTLEAGY